MIDITQSFGALLKSRRLAVGMTQTELALFLGTGVRFVVELEAGKATCQLGKALNAAEALGVGFSIVRDERGQGLGLRSLPEGGENG